MCVCVCVSGGGGGGCCGGVREVLFKERFSPSGVKFFALRVAPVRKKADTSILP